MEKQVIFKKTPIGKTNFYPSEIKYIRSLADLPSPNLDSKIRLENMNYVFLNDVVMPYTFIIPNNCVISGNILTGSRIIYTGGTILRPLFEDTGELVNHVQSFTLENIEILTCLSSTKLTTLRDAKLFHTWNYSQLGEPSINIRNCIFRGGRFGNLNGRNVEMSNCTATGMFQGIENLLNYQSFTISNNNFFEWKNIAGTIMLNAGAVENLHISDNVFKPKTNETIFDFTEITSEQSVLASSNQFHIGKAGQGALLTPTSKTKKDPQIIFIGNTNVADSTIVGLLNIKEPTVIIIPQNAFQPIDISPYENTADLCERIVQNVNTLTYTSQEAVVVSASISISVLNPSAYDNIHIFTALFKNGIEMTQSNAAARINIQDRATLSFSCMFELEKDDVLDLRVKSMISDVAVDLMIENLVVIVKK